MTNNNPNNIINKQRVRAFSRVSNFIDITFWKSYGNNPITIIIRLLFTNNLQRYHRRYLFDHYSIIPEVYECSNKFVIGIFYRIVAIIKKTAVLYYRIILYLLLSFTYTSRECIVCLILIIVNNGRRASGGSWLIF